MAPRVRDEESIKTPGRSPGKDAGPDPLQAIASQPTKQQVRHERAYLWLTVCLCVGVCGVGRLSGWIDRSNQRRSDAARALTKTKSHRRSLI